MTEPVIQPAQNPSSNEGQAMGITSLVLGILSMLTAWIPIIGLIAWILAPLGLLFGFLSVGKPAGKGFAIAGLVTSGIGLLICILWVAFIGAAIANGNVVTTG
jgi:hypothetical protein